MSANATECPHGELIGMPCPPCQASERGERPGWQGPGELKRQGRRTFVAQYHGRCVASCGVPINPGDTIVRVWVEDDQQSGWTHVDCAPS